MSGAASEPGLRSMTLFQPFRDPNKHNEFLLKVFIVADEFQLMC